MGNSNRFIIMGNLSKYVDDVYTEIDTNTSATTPWVDITTCEFLSLYIESNTGAHTAHVVSIELSPDGIFSSGIHDINNSSITGEGHKFIDASNMAFVRMVVTTQEGGASTCDFYLQGLRHE